MYFKCYRYDIECIYILNILEGIILGIYIINYLKMDE